MKSKAAIGGHPLHPAFVVLPIGSWCLALFGDVMYQFSSDAFWYQFSYYTMLAGVVSALIAAVFGFVDFFGVKMSESGYRTARMHMALNLTAVVLYAANLWLRHDNAAMAGSRWNLAFAMEVITLLAVAVSGWLGGELAYRHKVGVVENADPEATRIGIDEPVVPQRAPSRERGLMG